MKSSYLADVRVVGIGAAGLAALEILSAAGPVPLGLIAMDEPGERLDASRAPVKLAFDAGSRDLPIYEMRKTITGADLLIVISDSAKDGDLRASAAFAEIAIGGLEDPPLHLPVVRLLTVDDAEARRRAIRNVWDDESTVVPVAVSDELAEHALASMVRALADPILRPGLVNLSFRELVTVFDGAYLAAVGRGVGRGFTRARQAAREASRLTYADLQFLDPLPMDPGRTSRLLVSISGPRDLSLFEANEVVEEVQAALDADLEVTWSAGFGGEGSDSLTVTCFLLWTGPPAWRVY